MIDFICIIDVIALIISIIALILILCTLKSDDELMRNLLFLICGGSLLLNFILCTVISTALGWIIINLVFAIFNAIMVAAKIDERKINS